MDTQINEILDTNDWLNATVVTWKTPAQNFKTAQDLLNYLEKKIIKMVDIEAERSGDTKKAHYREVWQKDEEHYIVVSWNIGRKMSEMSLAAEHAFETLRRTDDFEAEIVQITYGKNFIKEAAYFSDCVRVLETVDGNLVAVKKIRRALCGIQATNGYSLRENPIFEKIIREKYNNNFV